MFMKFLLSIPFRNCKSGAFLRHDIVCWKVRNKVSFFPALCQMLINSKKRKEQMNFESNNDKRQLLSCGYLRKYFSSKNVNPTDIASILSKFLPIDWKFDYFHDYRNAGLSQHGIENNGKTLKCNCTLNSCYCFFISYSFAMKPNSGKYITLNLKINLKIAISISNSLITRFQK